MVPLALMLPGDSQETADEVVLASGPPVGLETEAEEPADAPADDFVFEVDAGAHVDIEAQSAVEDASAEEAQEEDDVAPRLSTRSAGSLNVRRTSATRATTTTVAVRRSPTTVAAVKVTTAPTAPPKTAPPKTAPPPTPTTVSTSDVWYRLAICESGNTNDHDAPYYGYWQFSAATWQGLGMTGLPDQHSRDVQLATAKRLQALQGWAPWPGCARSLGLI